MADSAAALATATELRDTAKATFVLVAKDLSESQEACAAATDVLREYYEGASFIQLGEKAKDQTDEQGDGSGILWMFERQPCSEVGGVRQSRLQRRVPRPRRTRRKSFSRPGPAGGDERNFSQALTGSSP